jgi:hypothetical protein
MSKAQIVRPDSGQIAFRVDGATSIQRTKSWQYSPRSYILDFSVARYPLLFFADGTAAAAASV